MKSPTLHGFLDELEKIAVSPADILKLQKSFGRLGKVVRPMKSGTFGFTRRAHGIPAARIPGQSGFVRGGAAQAEAAGLQKSQNLEKLLAEGKLSKQEALSQLKLNKPSPPLKLQGQTATEIVSAPKAKTVMLPTPTHTVAPGGASSAVRPKVTAPSKRRREIGAIGAAGLTTAGIGGGYGLNEAVD